jgi:hypothetical protein
MPASMAATEETVARFCRTVFEIEVTMREILSGFAPLVTPVGS